MPMRTVWHAIFEWFEDGVRHVAYRGDTVDVPESVIEQYGKFGVFDAPKVEDAPAADGPIEPPLSGEEVPPPVETVPVDEGTGVKLPVRPKQAAPVKVWEDYAVELHEATNGEKGYTRDEAEAASKQDLIAALVD